MNTLQRLDRASRRPKILVATVVIGLTLMIGAGPAAADYYGSGTSRNGNVYLIKQDGYSCHFSGNAPTLGSCTNNLSEVDNDGYTYYGYVNLFWGPNYTGAYACISPGDFWVQSGHWAGSNGPPVTFSRGSGPGKGESIWNNVASIQWVSRCSG
jgi:hypothetical protein